jgi:hypothetical protein
MNHRAPVNLRDGDLNSVLMVLMKVFLNQGVQNDQKSHLNLDEMMGDQKMDGRLMDDQKMNHQMMDDRLMDDQKMDVRNYLDDLNFRDALPYAYSLISIEI